jgi:hypothetical protein
LAFVEIASVLVRFDHAASRVVNADYSIVRTTAVHRIADCIRDRIRFAIPQATEWERIGNQIDATMILRGRTS